MENYFQNRSTYPIGKLASAPRDRISLPHYSRHLMDCHNLTHNKSFPLPRMDSTLDRLYGKTFFTTFDLASGYWQIELDDPSKEKTAFFVENNLYEFIPMPFGLCKAPATFQRVMNYILRELSGIKALVYLDDVIIFSETFDDHLRDSLKKFLN